MNKRKAQGIKIHPYDFYKPNKCVEEDRHRRKICTNRITYEGVRLRTGGTRHRSAQTAHYPEVAFPHHRYPESTEFMLGLHPSIVSTAQRRHYGQEELHKRDVNANVGSKMELDKPKFGEFGSINSRQTYSEYFSEVDDYEKFFKKAKNGKLECTNCNTNKSILMIIFFITTRTKSSQLFAS